MPPPSLSLRSAVHWISWTPKPLSTPCSPPSTGHHYKLRPAHRSCYRGYRLRRQQKFLAACRLAIFQTIIRLDYIGRHDFASADHLQMTVKRLRMLTLDFWLSGRVIHATLT
jgi:hypothetical protein